MLSTAPPQTLCQDLHVHVEVSFSMGQERNFLLICLSLFQSAESLSVTICEGSRKAISCKNGKKLNIQEALYGRLNRETCNRLPIRSTNCRSARSLPVMQSRCQGRASCVLNASNSVFGDPCHGTVKYLLVKFQCIE